MTVDVNSVAREGRPLVQRPRSLAVAAHRDFDDTPLWNENNDGNYGNDGVRWHTDWVVLVKDGRVPGGLGVKEFRKADAVVLPPTNPEMDMYMDSPGYSVLTRSSGSSCPCRNARPYPGI